MINTVYGLSISYWGYALATILLETLVVFLVAHFLQRLIPSAEVVRRGWISAFGISALLSLHAFCGFQTPDFPWPQWSGKLIRPEVQATLSLVGPTEFSNLGLNAVQVISNLTPSPISTRAQIIVHWPVFLWFSGFLLVGLWMLFPRLWIRWQLMRSLLENSVSDQLTNRVSRLGLQLGLRKQVLIFRSRRLASPVAFGVRRGVIGIPADFETQYSEQHQDAMMVHELAHLLRRDPVVIALADICVTCMWWNPGFWWARRQLRNACERAADEASKVVENGPRLLAESLVGLALTWNHRGLLNLLGVEGFRSDLGKRIERLAELDKGGSRSFGILGNHVGRYMDFGLWGIGGCLSLLAINLQGDNHHSKPTLWEAFRYALVQPNATGALAGSVNSSSANQSPVELFPSLTQASDDSVFATAANSEAQFSQNSSSIPLVSPPRKGEEAAVATNKEIGRTNRTDKAMIEPVPWLGIASLYDRNHRKGLSKSGLNWLWWEN